ncbi:hypothetical protein B4N89_17240 [Embleya scabrispora]|uniref:Uncharacterized protein n=1 Tax=Embleya scabrispora TaxID=159449 RepID=A0A1T3P0K8_9ACTN|nr:hypothetical protein [Embleya scabrispora]OPC82451.1 hypothetical protein B4N89_17240 [Embleya scabrispora]
MSTMTHLPAHRSLRMPALRGSAPAATPFADLVRARLRRPAYTSARIARGTWIFTSTAVRVTLLGRHAVP